MPSQGKRETNSPAMPIFSLVLLTISILKFGLVRAVTHGVKWNKRLADFEPISGLSSHESTSREIEVYGRRTEKLNLNGLPVQLTYFEDFGFFHFTDNDTKATGVCGDIYTLLSTYLNFTLVLTNSGNESLGVSFKNGTYNGILEYARLNQTDIIPKMPVFVTRLKAVSFAPTLWMNSQRIFAYGQWKRNYAWMFTLFPMDIWVSIIFIILTLSVVSLITEKVLRRIIGRQLRSRSYLDHFFYVSSTLFNQVNGTDSIASGSKILALTISIFCFLTLIGYNSHLIYSMTEETFDAPFNDLDTLLRNTKFDIVVIENTVAYNCFTSPYTYDIFKVIWKAKRVKVVQDVEELYRHVCYYPNKYVIFDAVDSMAVRRNTICQLTPVGESYFTIPVAAGISKRFQQKKTLDIGIMRLHEFGIINAIKKRYMSPPSKGVAYRMTDSLTIDLDRVSMIFVVLCCGIVASIVICVVENVIFSFKTRRTVKKYT